MIYTSFQIKNYKGVDNVTVNLLNNRIITLVGLNESGKTSIMEGMHLFYKMVKGSEPSEQQLKDYRQKGTAFTGTILISASLRIELSDKEKIRNYWKHDLAKKSKLEIGDDFKYEYKFRYEKHTYKDTSRNVTITLKTGNSKTPLSSSDAEAWQKIIKFIRTEIIPEILYYDDFILQIPTETNFPKSGEKKLSGVQYTDPWMLAINDILKSVDSRFDFQDDIVDIWEKDNDAAVNRIAEMENALNNKITKRWGDLFGKDRINFKEIKLETKYLNNILSVSFKIKTATNRIFNVNERSKGFKWFFSFLLFTEFRKRRTKNILFLLDEPASNLHPTAQAHILDAIDELSQDSLVIYSTHSHHLINPHWLAGAFICMNENQSIDVLSGGLDINECAKISVVSYYKFVGEGYSSDKISYFQPILNSLDYRPSLLEPIPNIVILEGKNDWYTFLYFFELILNKKTANKYYPGAGANKLEEIIRLYLAWGKKFIVILDGDNAGIDAKKQYKKTFGPIVEERIFTLHDILERHLVTEDLITATDQKKIYDAVYGNGSYETFISKNSKTSSSLKSNINYAINQLQFSKKKIAISTETKANFNNVFKFIEEKTT